jgi:hypothetical protein
LSRGHLGARTSRRAMRGTQDGSAAVELCPEFGPEQRNSEVNKANSDDLKRPEVHTKAQQIPDLKSRGWGFKSPGGLGELESFVPSCPEIRIFEPGSTDPRRAPSPARGALFDRRRVGIHSHALGHGGPSAHAARQHPRGAEQHESIDEPGSEDNTQRSGSLSRSGSSRRAAALHRSSKSR